MVANIEVGEVIRQGSEGRIYIIPFQRMVDYFHWRKFKLPEGTYVSPAEANDVTSNDNKGYTVRGELSIELPDFVKDEEIRKSIKVIVKERFSKKYRHPELDSKLNKKRILQEGRALRKLSDPSSTIKSPMCYGSDIKNGLLFIEFVEGVTVKQFVDQRQYLLDFLHVNFAVPEEEISDDEDEDEDENDDDRESKRSKTDPTQDTTQTQLDGELLIKDLENILDKDVNGVALTYSAFGTEPVLKFVKDSNVDMEYKEFIKAMVGLAQLFMKIGSELGYLHDSDMIHGDLTTSNIMVRDDVKGQKTSAADRLVFIDFGLSYNTNIIEDKGVDMYVLERTLISSHHNSSCLFDILITGYLQNAGSNGQAVKNKFEQVRLRGRKRTEFG